MLKDTDQTKQSLIHDVMPRFFFWRFVFTYPDKTKGYTVRKAETKDNAITDFNKIFPELKYYRIDFLNEA
jgi:hypothetical protein